MEIKWLRKASKSLVREATHISKENPEASKRVVKKIRKTVELLADNPALGHVGRLHGTRELVIPNLHYLIPYRINLRKQRVEILHVFHTSRKMPERW